MANTVDEFDFDEHDTIASRRRKRLSTSVTMTPSDYLNKDRQAVFTNTAATTDDEDEDTTSL